MILTLYEFSKANNSTKLVNVTGTEVNVDLKDDTNLLNPTFEISTTFFGSNFNYCSFNNRYYFIRNWVKRNRNISEIECEIDVLATWRSAILASYQYVERSASNVDLDLIDSQFLSSTEIVQSLSATSPSSIWDYTSGCYILHCAGSGGEICYVLSKYQLIWALDFMYTEGNFSDFISDETIKYFFDPLKYITNVQWFPIGYRVVPSDGGGNIILGFWDTGVSGYFLSNGVYDPILTVNIPATRYYNDFRDFDNNFTEILLMLPGYGVYKLPAEYAGQTIQAKYCIDFRTGECTIFLRVNQIAIADVSFQMGVDIKLSQTGVNVSGAASAAQEIGAGAMSANPLMIAEGISNGLQAQFQPLVQSKGTQGNVSRLRSEPDIKASVIRRGTSGNPQTRKGRVCMKHLQLSGLSGYAICSNANISINGTSAEKEMIENYLNSGFYIE